MRSKLSERDKSYLGTYCCNCGKTEDIQYHHIVPLALGGNDVISNMCCLCGECHSKLHYGKVKSNISAATKAGIERARKRGSQIGNKPGTTFTTKKSIKSKAIILRNSIEFYGHLNDAAVMELCELSRNTYYKYKRELKQEKIDGIDILAKYDDNGMNIQEHAALNHSRVFKYRFEELI